MKPLLKKLNGLIVASSLSIGVSFAAEKEIDGRTLIPLLEVLEKSGDGLYAEDDHYRIEDLAVMTKAPGKKAFPETRLFFGELKGAQHEEIPHRYEFQASKTKNAYAIFAELFKNKIPLAPLEDFDERNGYVQKIVIDALDCDFSNETCLVRWSK